jgi:hypothetical protein
MNGVDMSNGGAASFDGMSVNQEQGFRIGGYNMANNFDVAEMSMAYLKVYAEAATAADVQEMCSALGIEVDPNASNNNNNNNDDVEDSDPTPVPSSNTDKKDQVDNTKTFDLGIVSLAAVALSSAVVVKKKRK